MPLNDNFIYQPPEDPLDILYQDEHYIAVNKPAGLLSVMGRLPQHYDSAYYRILQDYPQAKVIHRLDMATSGILLFAKHRDAEIAMSKLFQARQVEKYYLAVVAGQVITAGSVDVPLIADWDNRPKQKVDFEQGKSAKTLYQPLHYDEKQQYSLIKLTPITGRSHQLRVHMAYIGHPIIGDKIYNPHAQLNPFLQMCLHSAFLGFIHPLTGQQIHLSSLPPFLTDKFQLLSTLYAKK